MNKITTGVENASPAIFAPIMIPVRKQPKISIRIAFFEIVYFPIFKDIMINIFRLILVS